MIAFDVWRDETKASQENLRVGKVHNLCELNPPPSHPGAINNGLLLSSSPVNTSLPGVAHEGPPPGLLTPSTIYSVTPSLVSADGLWTVQEFNLAVSKYIVPPLDPPPLARVLRSSYAIVFRTPIHVPSPVVAPPRNARRMMSVLNRRA